MIWIKGGLSMKNLVFTAVLAAYLAVTSAVPVQSPCVYTQAIEAGDFTVYLPSEARLEFLDYVVGDCTVYIYVIEDDADLAYYSESAQALYESTRRLYSGPNEEVVWADECVGTVTMSREHGHIYAFSSREIDFTRLFFSASNRRSILTITIESENTLSAIDLMHGIIDHIVAPEMPLEEAGGQSSYAFTQAVEMGDYIVYLPSGVQELPVGYIVGDCAISIGLSWKDDPRIYYTETVQERYEILLAALEASGDPNSEIVWVDECVGATTTTREHGSIYALGIGETDYVKIDFSTTNRKEMLWITVRSENAQSASELMRGILEHIVAPEMPLS